jgi:hypothetical protein
VGFVDDDDGASVAFDGFSGEECCCLGHDFGFVESGVCAECVHDRDVKTAGAECGVWDVDDVMSGWVKVRDGGTYGNSFSCANVSGDDTQG